MEKVRTLKSSDLKEQVEKCIASLNKSIKDLQRFYGVNQGPRPFEIDSLLEEVKKNLETPEGKKYEKLAAEYFSRTHFQGMQKCLASTEKPDTLGFSVLVNVDERGKVRKTLLNPETNVGLCLAKDLEEANFPRPPKRNHWVQIKMNIR